MITAQDINNIIGITESYELPNELLWFMEKMLTVISMKEKKDDE